MVQPRRWRVKVISDKGSIHYQIITRADLIKFMRTVEGKQIKKDNADNKFLMNITEKYTLPYALHLNKNMTFKTLELQNII